MDHDLRPGPLPDYFWAGVDPVEVPLTDWGVDPAPLTADDPQSIPAAPAEHVGDLVQVAHPRIRVLGAYWHEGWPFARPDTLLRPGAAERLYRAVAQLPAGFGLAVWDAWRDPRLQRVLHDTVYQDASLAPGFVATPDPDPDRCPPHASGGTVDLTLTWRNQPLALGTLFDAFVPQAAATWFEPGGPARPRQLRRLLGSVMGSQGFVVHPQEWWHWEYGTRMWAAITHSEPLYGVTEPLPDPTSGVHTDT